MTNQLVIAIYSVPQPQYCFGITPKFVTVSMKETFQSATVIMMGCEGLNNTRMAEAFVQKGAKTYIGWTGSVSASRTDTATTQLLKHLVTQKQTIEEAVQDTMMEVGSDPDCKSMMEYYPGKAGSQTIETS